MSGNESKKIKVGQVEPINGLRNMGKFPGDSQLALDSFRRQAVIAIGGQLAAQAEVATKGVTLEQGMVTYQSVRRQTVEQVGSGRDWAEDAWLHRIGSVHAQPIPTPLDMLDRTLLNQRLPEPIVDAIVVTVSKAVYGRPDAR